MNKSHVTFDFDLFVLIKFLHSPAQKSVFEVGLQNPSPIASRYHITGTSFYYLLFIIYL